MLTEKGCMGGIGARSSHHPKLQFPHVSVPVQGQRGNTGGRLLAALSSTVVLRQSVGESFRCCFFKGGKSLAPLKIMEALPPDCKMHRSVFFSFLCFSKDLCCK